MLLMVSTNIYEQLHKWALQWVLNLNIKFKKWLGSLYSVGMSSTSIQNLANAIGMLGSGNVSGLASSGNAEHYSNGCF